MGIDFSNPRWMVGFTSENIKEFSDEEIVEAAKIIPQCISFIKEPSVELQRKLIASKKSNVVYINNLDDELAIEVLMTKPDFIKDIQNPTPLMISIAKIYS